MPAWIHDRQERIRKSNPSMPESEAWALATQQSHALGKSPKGYGTAEGRAVAKSKYKTPCDDQKTAQLAGFLDEFQKIAGPGLRGVSRGAVHGALWGGVQGLAQGSGKKSKPESEHFSERHPAIARGLSHAAVGAGVGGVLGGHLTRGGLSGVANEVGKAGKKAVTKAQGAYEVGKADRAASVPNKERDELVDKALSKYKKG